jgi:rRNA maturation endonuclease Nob1
MFLEMQKVQLLEGDVWGHRKDINEYYTVPSSVIEQIRELKSEGMPAERIEERISKESKLKPDMISYILNKETLA